MANRKFWSDVDATADQYHVIDIDITQKALLQYKWGSLTGTLDGTIKHYGAIDKGFGYSYLGEVFDIAVDTANSDSEDLYMAYIDKPVNYIKAIFLANNISGGTVSAIHELKV